MPLNAPALLILCKCQERCWVLQSCAPHRASSRENDPAGPAQRGEVRGSRYCFGHMLSCCGAVGFLPRGWWVPSVQAGSAEICGAAQRSQSTAAVPAHLRYHRTARRLPGQAQPGPEPVPSGQTTPCQPCWQRAQRSGSNSCSAMERLWRIPLALPSVGHPGWGSWQREGPQDSAGPRQPPPVFPAPVWWGMEGWGHCRDGVSAGAAPPRRGTCAGPMQGAAALFPPRVSGPHSRHG